ncbi:MAG: heparan-alpha-glucosaminide N-acetyltransferase domain-containing protein [Planctomycetaceae bacterium]
MMSDTSGGRVVSMDQFRGYTVAGMFLVNFLGNFAAIHAVLKHNQTYFSYADSIMPSFMFAVGFSYRLTFLRRRGQVGWVKTSLSYIRRSMALVAVSLAMYGLGGGFGKIGEFEEMPDEYQPRRAFASAPAPEFLNQVHAELEAIKDPAAPPAVELEKLSAEEKAARMKEFEEQKKSIAEQRAAVQKKFADIAAGERAKFTDAEVERRASFEALPYGRKIWLGWKIFLLKLAKSQVWETLAIIGMTQIVLLPVIAAPTSIRVIALFGLCAWDIFMAHWFNWGFVHGYRDNWMVQLWGTGTDRSWDGGFFGALTWGIAMLGGTITFDIMRHNSNSQSAATKLACWGVGLMVLGYSLSCMTRLYEYNAEELKAHKETIQRQNKDKAWLGSLIARANEELKPAREQIGKLQGEIAKVKKGDFDAAVKKLREDPANEKRSSFQLAEMAEKQVKSAEKNPKITELEAQVEKIKADSDYKRREADIAVIGDQLRSFPNLEMAASPVIPDWSKLKSRSLSELIVEPPMMAPPEDEPRVDPEPHISHRAWNYWLMGKRMPTVTFMLFATGFAFALYALFILVCDVGGIRLGMFRTFGMNPLAAYIIHGMMEHAIVPLVPRDAPLWYCMAGFAFFFGATYVFVKYLEENEIYLRL